MLCFCNFFWVEDCALCFPWDAFLISLVLPINRDYEKSRYTLQEEALTPDLSVHCLIIAEDENIFVELRTEYLPTATKFGQDNIFTPVCHSVHRGGLWQGEPPLQGDPPPGREAPSQHGDPAGKETPLVGRPPIRHTVNERPVGILLECILV